MNNTIFVIPNVLKLYYHQVFIFYMALIFTERTPETDMEEILKKKKNQLEQLRLEKRKLQEKLSRPVSTHALGKLYKRYNVLSKTIFLDVTGTVELWSYKMKRAER